MFNVEENLATVAVVFDEDVERIRALHPSEESGIGREGDDRVFDDREVPLERLRIFLQERIDETEQLHNPLVLSESTLR